MSTYQFSHLHKHRNPWKYVVTSIRTGEDTAPQGEHGCRLVAIAGITTANGDSLEAIIGDVDLINNMIATLELTRDKLLVEQAQLNVDLTERKLKHTGVIFE